MPIVSGGGGGGGGGNLTLLSNTILGADGSLDISTISQAYNDLVLIGLVRGTRAFATDGMMIRFNNDSVGHYDWSQVFWTGAVSGAGAGSASSGNIFQIAAASATAGEFTAIHLECIGYAGSGLKSCTGYATAGQATTQGGVWWAQTAAINRITLFGATTANLLAGSSLRIYGVT